MLKRALELAPTLIAWRRHFHRYPELGLQEHETAAFLCRELQRLGLHVETGIGGTGVVSVLNGSRPYPVVALRADMDALPLQEKTGQPFASSVQGVMHACGHDAHMAVVLGAAALLSADRDKIRGRVKFIFQPCEETPPGGAAAMIEDGCLRDPEVNVVVGVHVEPFLPAGVIGIKEGVAMAAADMFKLRVFGSGGHGATPHLTVDTTVILAEIIMAWQSIVSRRVDPLESVVVSVGTIRAGEKANIIAGQAELTGTVRTLNPELRQKVPEIMNHLAGHIAAAHGATVEFELEEGYPPLVNNRLTLQVVERAALSLLGPDKVCSVEQPSMGGEDFSYFASLLPAAYFYLGVRREGFPALPWHHPQFDIDESALPVGAAVMTQVALDYLREDQ